MCRRDYSEQKIQKRRGSISGIERIQKKTSGISLSSADSYDSSESVPDPRRRSVNLEKYDLRRNSLTGNMKCPECSLMVYNRDPQVVFDGSVYHTSCARCKDCGVSLNISNIRKAPEGESLLCETHYKKRILHRSTELMKIMSAKKAKIRGGTPTDANDSWGEDDLESEQDPLSALSSPSRLRDTLEGTHREVNSSTKTATPSSEQSSNADGSYSTPIPSELVEMQTEIDRLRALLTSEREVNTQRVSSVRRELDQQNDLHQELLGLSELVERFDEALRSGKVEEARALEARARSRSESYKERRFSILGDSLKTSRSVRFEIEESVSPGEQALHAIDRELRSTKERLEGMLAADDSEMHILHEENSPVLDSRPSSDIREEKAELMSRLEASIALIHILEERLYDAERQLSSKEAEHMEAIEEYRETIELNRKRIAELENGNKTSHQLSNTPELGQSILVATLSEIKEALAQLESESVLTQDPKNVLSGILRKSSEAIGKLEKIVGSFATNNAGSGSSGEGSGTVQPTSVLDESVLGDVLRSRESELSALRVGSEPSPKVSSSQGAVSVSDRERYLAAEVAILRDRLSGSSGEGSGTGQPTSVLDESVLGDALRSCESELDALDIIRIASHSFPPVTSDKFYVFDTVPSSPVEVSLHNELRRKDSIIAALLLKLQDSSPLSAADLRNSPPATSADGPSDSLSTVDIAATVRESGAPDSQGSSPVTQFLVEPVASLPTRPKLVTIGSQTDFVTTESEYGFDRSRIRVAEVEETSTDDMYQRDLVDASKKEAFSRTFSSGSGSYSDASSLHVTSEEHININEMTNPLLDSGKSVSSEGTEGNSKLIQEKFDDEVSSISDFQLGLSTVSLHQKPTFAASDEASQRLLAVNVELEIAKERVRTLNSMDENEKLTQHESASLVEYFTEQVTRLEDEVRTLKNNLNVAQRANNDSLLHIAELKDKIVRQQDEIERLCRQNTDKEDEILKVLHKYQCTYNDIQMLDHAIIQLTDQIDKTEKTSRKKVFGFF